MILESFTKLPGTNFHQKSLKALNPQLHQKRTRVSSWGSLQNLSQKPMTNEMLNYKCQTEMYSERRQTSKM